VKDKKPEMRKKSIRARLKNSLSLVVQSSSWQTTSSLRQVALDEDDRDNMGYEVLEMFK
jgi:hypothetical protein